MSELARNILLCASICVPIGAVATERPTFYGDGIHDDGPALVAIARGETVTGDPRRLHQERGSYAIIAYSYVKICDAVDLSKAHFRFLNDSISVSSALHGDGGIPFTDADKANIFLDLSPKEFDRFIGAGEDTSVSGSQISAEAHCDAQS